jgi:hypothetical protein
MSNKREVKKQVISKQDLLDYLEQGPKHFHEDITELTNMCQTLFERMFDLYDDNLAAKIAQLKFQLTITINEKTVVPLLSENNDPVICDWSFGCTGPLDKEDAEKEALL